MGRNPHSTLIIYEDWFVRLSMPLGLPILPAVHAKKIHTHIKDVSFHLFSCSCYFLFFSFLHHNTTSVAYSKNSLVSVETQNHFKSLSCRAASRMMLACINAHGCIHETQWLDSESIHLNIDF